MNAARPFLFVIVIRTFTAPHEVSRSLTQSRAVSRTSVYIQYVPNSIRGYFRIWCEQELVIKLYMILLFWLSRLKFEQENSISFEMALCE